MVAVLTADWDTYLMSDNERALSDSQFWAKRSHSLRTGQRRGSRFAACIVHQESLTCASFRRKESSIASNSLISQTRSRPPAIDDHSFELKYKR